MKTFNKYLLEEKVTDQDMGMLKEGLQSEWTPELEAQVDEAIDQFIAEYGNEDGTFDMDRLNEEMTNEGLFRQYLRWFDWFCTW